MSKIKFIVARYENDSFEGFLSESIEKYDHVFIENHQANSIFGKYNLGIEYWKENGLLPDDIVVFCHADVKILDEHFEEKLSYAFQKIPKLGIVGVIGTTELTEAGGWWLADAKNHRGHVWQWIDENESNKYHMVKQEGNFHGMVAVDGLLFATLGHIAMNLRFDSETYPESYDFYDLDYCLSVLSHGYKIAVLDILLEHKSAGTGVFKDSWKINREKFLTKWTSAGVKFPLSVKVLG
jgi:hypothetical protein